MVTGCGCTDTVVFGHQAACERELGPSYAGVARTDPAREAGQYSQEYAASEPESTVPNPFSAPRFPSWYHRIAHWGQ